MERQYHQWLFALCDLNSDGSIDVETDKPWLHSHSGLKDDVVDQVSSALCLP